MEPETIINIILSLVVLVLFIITTVKLYLRMRKIKLSNLVWLVGFFLCSSLVGICKAAGANAIGALFTVFELMFYIFEFLSLMFLIVFTKETFYKKQKSFFKTIFATAFTLSISSFTFVLLRIIEYSDMLYLIDVYFMSLTIFITALWNASTSFSAYNLIKEENINKNVKLRYKIIGISSVIFALQGFFAPLHVIVRTLDPALYEMTSSIYTLINVITLLIFAAGNFYAWITLGSKIEKSKVKTPYKLKITEEDLMKLAKTEG